MGPIYNSDYSERASAILISSDDRRTGWFAIGYCRNFALKSQISMRILDLQGAILGIEFAALAQYKH